MNKLTQQEMEDITFRNIIYMRRPELIRILNGENAVDVIPQSNQRRILRRDGVLETLYKHGGKTIKVTQRAKKQLGVWI